MNFLKRVRRLVERKEEPKRPNYMWEILNIILPSDKPRRRKNPYPQIGDMRIAEVFPRKD